MPKFILKKTFFHDFYQILREKQNYFLNMIQLQYGFDKIDY